MKKVGKLIADIAYRMALKYAGQASVWWEYQPKEPEKLKYSRNEIKKQ